jgi:hypothetical protein
MGRGDVTKDVCSVNLLTVTCVQAKEYICQQMWEETWEFKRILHTYPPMKMGQSAPNCWNLNYRRRGITQNKACNIQNMVKV